MCAEIGAILPMKNNLVGVGVLLLGVAAVGYVVLFWVERPNRQGALDLKYEELKQYEFELGSIKIGEMTIPLLLEKKSGVTYRLIPNPEPTWVQLKYAPGLNLAGDNIDLPLPWPQGTFPSVRRENAPHKKLNLSRLRNSARRLNLVRT